MTKLARAFQEQSIRSRLGAQLSARARSYNPFDAKDLSILKNTRLRSLVPTDWLHERQVKAVLQTKWFYVWDSTGTVFLAASDRFCPYLGEFVPWERMSPAQIAEAMDEHMVKNGLFQPRS